MTIKTIFNRGEDTYIVKDSTIARFKVIGFRVDVNEDCVHVIYFLRNYILLDFGMCKLGNDVIEVNENDCYKTLWDMKIRFEFLESLTCIADEEPKQSEVEIPPSLSDITTKDDEDDLPF